MEQQTAVEIFANEVCKKLLIVGLEIEFNQILEQVKEIEKKQIMNAYMKNLPIKDGVITAVQKAENYYNETFKNK